MNEKVKMDKNGNLVEGKAFLFWDSYNEGTYDVGRTKAKRERYLEKKLEAKERKYENGDNRDSA